MMDQSFQRTADPRSIQLQPLDPQARADVLRLIKHQQVPFAIECYRQATRASLSEAVHAVMLLRREQTA